MKKFIATIIAIEILKNFLKEMDKMKRFYQKPELDVLEFVSSDVLGDSLTTPENQDDIFGRVM